jgi:hypothetical protein
VDPPPLVRLLRRVTQGSGIVTSPRCADDQAIKPGDAMGKCVPDGVLAIISKDGKIMEHLEISIVFSNILL